MRKMMLQRTILPLLPSAGLPGGPLSGVPEDGAPPFMAAAWAYFRSLGNGVLALYGASALFVVIGLCLMKKSRTTALLLLVTAGLLAYVAYSLVSK